MPFLRISMAGYRQFLERWVEWLNSEAIGKVLAEEVSLQVLEHAAQSIPDDGAAAALA